MNDSALSASILLSLLVSIPKTLTVEHLMKKFLLLLSAFPVSAFAATVQISAAGCLSFDASTDASGNVTLTCNLSAAPTPTPTPAPAPAPSPAPAPIAGDACSSQGLSNTVASLDWGGGNLKKFPLNGGQSYSFPLGVTPIDGWGGQISTVYGGTQKIISISAEKCDFSQELEIKRCLIGGNDPGLNYTNNPRNFFACVLTPGIPYYVNIRNAVLNGNFPVRPIEESCAGDCQFAVQY